MTISEPSPRQPRPQLHFTPPNGWINDPNGLVYLDGEYHLFYQHHPDSTVWGPMYWGHAVSHDLIHWQTLPIALAPDDIGMIFSGSAVIDHANTAGFGANTMVAIFTHNTQDRGQAQSLAYSLDQGRTWAKYAHNPVLQYAALAGAKDFRDPKVFWYDDGQHAHWVMALAVAREIHFYRSTDLKHWTESSRFGADFGSHTGVWECPELCQLNIQDTSEKRWVLIVSVGNGAPAGGSGVQYFIGDFDGEVFTSDDPPARIRWVDYGADFYAPQAWNAAPDGRKVWLAWMNNWSYANQIPDADGWRGAMSLPRELSLCRDGADVVLIQQPVRALSQMPTAVNNATSQHLENTVISLSENVLSTCAIKLIAHIDASTTAAQFGLRMRADAEHVVQVTYRPQQQHLSVERRAAGPSVADFGTPHGVALAPRHGNIDLYLVIDQTSLEIFADGGRIVLTDLFFLDGFITDTKTAQIAGIELFAEDGAVHLTYEIQNFGSPE